MKQKVMVWSNTTFNTSVLPTDSTNSPQCLFNKDVYDVYCLIPSLFIITILAFLNKRVRIKPETCGGRPGLVLPINFLSDSTYNRLSIAVAFGVIAGNCIDLFSSMAGLNISSSAVVKLSGMGPWEKAVNTVVWVLLYGVINFPIFACLMTEHLLIGAVFGFLYTLMKFVALMVLLLSCPSPYTEQIQEGELNNAYRESELYESIPGLLCHIFLLLRFLLLLLDLQRRFRGRRFSETEDSNLVVAKEHQILHVRQLFGIAPKSDTPRVETKHWLFKLKDKIYKPRPDFKFSTGMVSTLTVIVIFLYYLTMYLALIAAELTELVIKARKDIKDPMADNKSFSYSLKKSFVELSDVFLASFYLSVFFTSIFSVLMMLQFMKCHRCHVLMSYKTRNLFDNSPSRLVGRSLSYPGYQIAYVGWGYIILMIITFIVFFIIGFIIKYGGWSVLVDFANSSLPVFVVPICVWIFQYLLGLLVFRDRRFPDVSININNHRLYCIISFFFFFFNILVGFFSSIFRVLKSMFLGIFFLSRIDCSPLMIGYHNWDQGYMSYIGFLNVLKSFSHPVMVVFCQHLLDLRLSAGSCRLMENEVFNGDTMTQPVIPCASVTEAHERRKSYPVSKTAFNRWFLAYTLLKNPDLQPLRKRIRRLEAL